MGCGLADLVARQHSDLTDAAAHPTDTEPAWLRNTVLAGLTADGFLSAVAAALFLPLHLGPVPFPVSALISGLVNAALVWVALKWTSAPRIAALPLWAWLVTVGVLTLGGPGGDIVFGGTGFATYAVLVLLILGAAPPGYLIWRHARRP